MYKVDNYYLLGVMHWIVSAVALMATSAVVKDFKVSGFISALIIAVVLAFANTFVRPVLVFLTLPFTIITMGLFLLFVNAMVLKFCAAVVPGFRIETWTSAILGSVILAVINAILHYIFI